MQIMSKVTIRHDNVQMLACTAEYRRLIPSNRENLPGIDYFSAQEGCILNYSSIHYSEGKLRVYLRELSA